MWSTPWARWPEVMWDPPRPTTSPPATRTPSGWWRSMAWALWWVQHATPAHTHLRRNLSPSRAAWNKWIICFCVFVWQWVSLQWEQLCLKILGNLEKVQEQKDLASFIFDTVLKSLNLLYINKSNREHNKMVMFHVCKMKAFHVDYFGLWLNEKQAFVSTSPLLLRITAQFLLGHCLGRHF